MTSDEMEDKYPHWKDALFGNHNAVANIRCAIHYVFWHGVYALLAVIGVVVVGAVKVAKTMARPLGPLRDPIHRSLDRFMSGVGHVLNHEYTEKVATVLLGGMFAIGSIVSIALLVYLFITQFWTMMQGLGMIIGMVVLAIVGTFLVEKLSNPAANAKDALANGARTAGEKAVETPGIRRVYGECPVSMDMAPKWFDNIFPEEEY